MRELTVKEFMVLTEGKKYNVSSIEGNGVSFNMNGITIIQEEFFGEIGFLKQGATCQVSFNIDDCIKSITQDENSGEFVIEFKLYMADVVLTEAEE